MLYKKQNNRIDAEALKTGRVAWGGLGACESPVFPAPAPAGAHIGDGVRQGRLVSHHLDALNDSECRSEVMRPFGAELVSWWRQLAGTSPSTGRPGRRSVLKSRVLVRRIFGKPGYLPYKQEEATRTVVEKAGVLSGTWAA